MLFAEQERIRARRDKRVPVVVFADIDGLKAINDNFGHAAGDAAIRLVSHALKSVLRESDIVARWGGDEFVALIGEGGEKAAEQIGQRLTGAIAALRPSSQAYRVSASVGMSQLDTAIPLSEALEKADAALYEIKKKSRE
jgi:diguanylate cyclase (GGDEF)-like protein